MLFNRTYVILHIAMFRYGKRKQKPVRIQQQKLDWCTEELMGELIADHYCRVVVIPIVSICVVLFFSWMKWI